EGVVEEVFRQAHEMGRSGECRGWGVLLRRLTADAALNRLRHGGPSEGRGEADRLRSALARLPGREAAVFALRYFGDLSPEEIADTLRLSRYAVAVSA